MRYLCVHGHFYQPPRENPSLEAIELQDSAYPYHDWNERITAECYAPNATRAFSTARSESSQFVNNYGTISFNFGPTLLSWLRKAPERLRAIREGDKLSQRDIRRPRLGHGASYNHMILPLANSRDKITQVKWGIRRFRASLWKASRRHVASRNGRGHGNPRSHG